VKVLVTGCRGYIGSVLAPFLKEQGFGVTGLDVGYFEDCFLEPAHEGYRMIRKDLREVSSEDVEGFDAIVHLAALSNDPLGEFSPQLTEEINFHGTVRLAMLAKAGGVSRFIYVSSQSMYGVSNSDEELEEDKSQKNPLTVYARTKWEAECELKKMNESTFTVVCFRPSTVFGVSPRLRCDIVFNNLVACAYTSGRIEIKSDGTPWRPVIHVQDVCQALLAGLRAPTSLIQGRSYNVGLPGGNFTVRQLAEAAARAVPGSTLTFTGEHGTDSRTYRVSFGRILDELGEWFRPSWNLDRGGRDLVEFFRRVDFTDQQFRGQATNRLPHLKKLCEEGRLDGRLQWA
jgi:nucleoside-diphosphate-sugar epimerase